jgi:DNA-binding NarL/FixJ family response regulator
LHGMELVAVAGCGRDAIELARAMEPDIVIMDLEMPDLNGLEATRAVMQERPGTKVIVITMHADDESLYSALRAGARGYIVKGAGHEEVASALRAVAQGDVVFGRDVADRILAPFGTKPVPVPDPFPSLTTREREVLELLAEGLGTKQIALRIHLADKTIRNLIASLMTKLEVPDRAQLIAYARRTGLGGESLDR